MDSAAASEHNEISAPVSGACLTSKSLPSGPAAGKKSRRPAGGAATSGTGVGGRCGGGGRPPTSKGTGATETEA
jgi:hypothetical protein